MPLSFRPPDPSEIPLLEPMIIEAFGPITWFRKIDDLYGPLNGLDWRVRWRRRLQDVFERQTMQVGESEEGIMTFASGTYDAAARSAYIDLLAVRPGQQGKGYGREALRAIIALFKQMGAQHAHLECLADNDAGNCLYASEGFKEVARSLRWWIELT